MRTDYNTPATVDFTQSLVCKKCPSKYCVLIKEGAQHFCPNYDGAMLKGNKGDYLVRCNKKEE